MNNLAKLFKNQPNWLQNRQKWLPKSLKIRGLVADAFFERLGRHLGSQKPEKVLNLGSLLATIFDQKSKKGVKKDIQKSMPKKYRKMMPKLTKNDAKMDAKIDDFSIFCEFVIF